MKEEYDRDRCILPRPPYIPEDKRLRVFYCMKITELSQRTLLIAAVIATVLVTAVAFAPTLGNGFTNWDDPIYVTENKAIMSLSWENVRSYFTSFHWGLYHPLVSLSFALEYHFFGLDPFVYHATNLVLHCAGTALALLFVFLLTGSVGAGFIAGLLFGLHPTHVESVAWIAERKDVLCAFFFFGSLVLYTRYLRIASSLLLQLAFVFFMLSLLSKSMAMTLPFVLLLIDYYLGRRIDKSSLVEKAPFFLFALVFALLSLLAHDVPHATIPFTLVQRFFAASYGILFYIAKLFVPVGLSAVYPYDGVLGDKLPLLAYAAPLILAAAAAVIWRTLRPGKTVLFGLLFFIITISPVLHLIPIGQGFPADRFLYIPSLGIFFVMAVALASAARKSRHALAGITAACVVAVCVLSLMTWQRTKVWHDSITLWNDVIEKYPQFPKAFKSRGDAYRSLKEYNAAIHDYSKALELYPRYVEALNNRGNTHDEQGRRAEAIQDYSGVLMISSANPQAYYNRGIAYEQLGDYQKAIGDYTSALRLLPKSAEIYNNRGVAQAKQGNLEQALDDFTDAIALEPRRGEFYRNRAYVHSLKGNRTKAQEDLKALQEMGYPVDKRFIDHIEGRS